jgi:7-carboxy-7-deazaguanine synthase
LDSIPSLEVAGFGLLLIPEGLAEIQTQRPLIGIVPHPPAPIMDGIMSEKVHLTINEIFHSIQGESTHMGRPCVFIRLTACDLRCSWCDTEYAFYEGSKKTIDEIITEISQWPTRLVEITGGEPLLQPNVVPLMERLLSEGYEVLVETGGHRPTDIVPAAVKVILDIKCPGSGEHEKMCWDNFERLREHDEVKAVIANRTDFDFALDAVRRYDLLASVPVHFSPVHGALAPESLAEWILESGLPIRYAGQLHKQIWSPDTRGV